MRRTGLGRHGGLDTEVSDPLDGLVNLFDIGIVLAVAFLVAGLGLAIDPASGRIESRTSPPTATPTATPTLGPVTSGRGQPLGQLYRLDDGRLVVVEPDGSRTPVGP